MSAGNSAQCFYAWSRHKNGHSFVPDLQSLSRANIGTSGRHGTYKTYKTGTRLAFLPYAPGPIARELRYAPEKTQTQVFRNQMFTDSYCSVMAFDCSILLDSEQ